MNCLSAKTLDFIKTAPPEWSASQVMQDVGMQFIDEHKPSAKAMEKLQIDVGYLTFLAIKRRVDTHLAEWCERDLAELKRRYSGA